MRVSETFNKFLKSYIDFISSSPAKAWRRACLAHCVCLGLLVVVVVALGFPFSPDVPLYLKDHESELRMAAFLETKITSTFDKAMADVQLSRSIDIDEQNKDLTIRFMVVAKGSKPLNDEDVLGRVVKLDDSLREVDGYEDHCLRTWSQDKFAIQNDPTKTAETKALNADFKTNSYCTPPISPLWGCALGNAVTGCNAITAMPAGIKNCKKSVCLKTDDFEAFDYDFAKMKIKQYGDAGVPAATATMTAHQMFYMVTDSKFDASNQNINAMMMVYKFGLPEPGYNNIKVDQSDQEDELIQWMYDAYNSMMIDHDDEDFEFFLYNTDHVRNKFIEEQLNKDALWISAAFIFAWSYLVGMTGSFWLGTMGIGQVFMCFFSSYNIYAVVFQQNYFGTFNVLAIFIILGIGADNVFVFLDTFAYSASLHKKLEDRMLYTWKRASLQLFVTSSVAFFAFFVQFLTSSFPAISTFGAFAASLVFMNYASVISFYPTCITVYHTKFSKSPFMFGLCNKCGSKKEDEPESNEPVDELSGVQRFFKNYWFPFIMKTRIIVIIICLSIIAFGIFKASELESDPNPPKFLPDEHPYQKMVDVVMEEFSRGGSELALEAHVVSGLVKDDPINRSGIEPTDREDRGVPNYDSNFSLPKAARCIVQLCDYFEQEHEDLSIGGIAKMYGVTCPVKEFKKHINDENMWNSITGTNANEDLFVEKGLEWFEDSSVYNAYKQYIYADRSPADQSKPIFTMTDIEFKLTVTIMTPYEDGTALYDRWGTFLDSTIFDGTNAAFSECPAIKKNFQPFVTGDEYTWDFFWLQDAMVVEAWLGIAYAIAVVFVIMLISTMNIIITLIGTGLIGSVVVCVIGFTVLNGWYLGLLESINFVIVPGFSINYVAFLCGGYMDSKYEKRADRVKDMLTSIGSSCISGSLSTLGACFFLFFPLIVFFNKFGTFIFVTIILSLTFSLGLFAAVMTFIGPEGNQGNIKAWFGKKKDEDTLPTTDKDIVTVRVNTPSKDQRRESETSSKDVVPEIVIEDISGDEVLSTKNNEPQEDISTKDTSEKITNEQENENEESTEDNNESASNNASIANTSNTNGETETPQ
eukprot:TRINITY_DN3397_c0_g2_i1.p1 TRINITY_DN3397_c0_g2~~TRINITY_DN3397_c0_g2_i1.p1  ORF type:complete len:1120 (+),score=360.69 TRINITY_DN3397_c0_g2_i1:84-3362(+)